MSTPYGEARPLPEPHRTAPGHARPPDPADAAMGAAARLWHRPGHPGRIERRAAGRHRLALPGAAPPRETEVDRGHLEDLGQQAAHARVSPDRGRAPAARVRAVALAD